MAQDMPTVVDYQGLRRKEKQNQKAYIALNRAADTVYKAISDAKVFNLSLEVATQYNLCRFVDKSPSDRTSDKLRTKILYFETKDSRYEVARFTNKDHTRQVYRLAKVSNPYFKDSAFFSKLGDKLPLSEEHLEEIIAENLNWQDLQWGIDSVRIKTSPNISNEDPTTE